jgi:DNA-binding transcriptional MocR family regulator
MHKPQVETELVVTSGSQDGLSKAIEMLMEEGDPVS